MAPERELAVSVEQIHHAFEPFEIDALAQGALVITLLASRLLVPAGHE